MVSGHVGVKMIGGRCIGLALSLEARLLLPTRSPDGLNIPAYLSHKRSGLPRRTFGQAWHVLGFY